MEFASEMVFKAYRRGLRVSEIPIDYFPRVGESKLNRFGDAWRHARFMLVYSPSWLYFLPGAILLVLGLVGAIVLATGPVDIFGRTWEIHTMLAWVLFAAWPFTRLVHVFSAPLGYLTRPYIVYRSRDTTRLGAREAPRGWERVSRSDD